MSTIDYRLTRKPSCIPAAALLALLAGCASSPEHGDAQYNVEAREKLRDLTCASDETPACIDRIGQPARCFCSSRDSLERLLEDPLYDDRPR